MEIFKYGQENKKMTKQDISNEQLELLKNVELGSRLDLEWGEISDKKMTFEESIEWCKSKGEGWRLPRRNASVLEEY